MFVWGADIEIFYLNEGASLPNTICNAIGMGRNSFIEFSLKNKYLFWLVFRVERKTKILKYLVFARVLSKEKNRARQEKIIYKYWKIYKLYVKIMNFGFLLYGWLLLPQEFNSKPEKKLKLSLSDSVLWV